MHRKLVIRLQAFFGISRKEARGAFMLISLSLMAVWTPFIFRRLVLPLFPVKNNLPTAAQLDSIAVTMSENNVYSNRNTGKNKYDKAVVVPGKLSAFDPNTADVPALTANGIPPFLAKRIDKFRSSGGRFRKRDDLLKIYDFPPELYRKLEAYIRIQHQEEPVRQVPGTANARKSIFAKKPASTTFDINTADTLQLVQLKGIGTKLSLRIIKFRDALGGFHSSDQYQEIFGLDSVALSELRKYAKIQSPIRKISVNSASPAELGQHVYLKNRKMVSVLVNYRTQHGPFSGLDDLRKTKVIDELTLERLAPYLAF